MNDITIVTTTYYPDSESGYKRLNVADKCIKSWVNLRYNGNIFLHIADDGSAIPLDYIETYWTKTISVVKRQGIGASLNAGFKKAFERSPIALYITDDWMLHSEIDLNPWVKLLEEDETIGMVRIGPPHPGLTGEVIHNNNRWYIRLHRHDFAYAMRPAIYHKRFFDKYGWFKENINCWETERIYNVNFCDNMGVNIVYALPHPWEHIDVLPLGQLEPSEVK